MLQFPYQDEALSGAAPPSLPASATVRWRPLVPVSILGPTAGRRFFPRALLDPGADDTVFPLAIAGLVGVALRPDSGHVLRWRGQGYALRFADVSLELSDGVEVWRWSAVIGLSPARSVTPSLDSPAACNSWTRDSLAKVESHNWKPTGHFRERLPERSRKC